jgi:twitching motility two-component system response regulator PilH
MSLNLQVSKASHYEPAPRSLRLSLADHSVVLMVKDREDTRSEMKRILELNGYRVIDTDNGQDAAKRAQYVYPDLLLVDLDVPLLYGIVAARQIVKNAQLGFVPVVIVTREREVDPAALAEAGVRRNEYVTRLSDYDELEQLLDYLLPAAPTVARSASPVHRVSPAAQLL